MTACGVGGGEIQGDIGGENPVIHRAQAEGLMGLTDLEPDRWALRRIGQGQLMLAFLEAQASDVCFVRQRAPASCVGILSLGLLQEGFFKFLGPVLFQIGQVLDVGPGAMKRALNDARHVVTQGAPRHVAITVEQRQFLFFPSTVMKSTGGVDVSGTRIGNDMLVM